MAAIAIHALLDDDPASDIGDNEAVQIEIKAILHRCAVDLGDQPARLSERRSVDADPITDRDKLLRRLPRVLAAPPANVDAEFFGERRQAALQRAEHARGDAG